VELGDLERELSNYERYSSFTDGGGTNRSDCAAMFLAQHSHSCDVDEGQVFGCRIKGLGNKITSCMVACIRDVRMLQFALQVAFSYQNGFPRWN
jgi:hypothetical protein